MNDLKDRNHETQLVNTTLELVNSLLENDLKDSLDKNIDDDVVYISVTSNGMTGQEWFDYFTAKGTKVVEAEYLLLSDDFKPTNGFTSVIAILKDTAFKNSKNNIKTIESEAEKRGFTRPNLEVACLLRDKYTNDQYIEMGLWRVFIMHKPLNDSGGYPSILEVDCLIDNRLDISPAKPNIKYDRTGGCGFAFTFS